MIQLSKKQKTILLSAFGLLVVGVVFFFIWALNAAPAEENRAKAVTTDSGLIYHETPEVITLISSTRQKQKGILMYPGARVQAAAYMAPYADFVKSTGVALIIVKPVLNLAIFDLRSPDRFMRTLPQVTQWYVAGHSLGGVKACSVVLSDPQAYAGLILLGSYCPNRIDDSIAVLSITGSEDGLSTPEKIKKNAAKLPEKTTFVEIQGMTHAQFGDYGDQSGDGVSAISQKEAWQDMKEALTEFMY